MDTTFDFETQLAQEMGTEGDTNVVPKQKRVRSKIGSGIRKIGRPYRKMENAKLNAYIIQMQDRVEVAETKYKLYAQRLKKYITEQEFREEDQIVNTN
jgi:signal peptidase I